MLLVNLSLWHTDQITKRLVDFIVSEKPLNFADQDALNYILDDKHLIYLPKKYNALIKIDKSWDKVSNNEEFPVLIHPKILQKVTLQHTLPHPPMSFSSDTEDRAS